MIFIFYAATKRLMITANSVVEFQNHVMKQEPQPILLNRVQSATLL